jgi:hypothetical protein
MPAAKIKPKKFTEEQLNLCKAADDLEQGRKLVTKGNRLKTKAQPVIERWLGKNTHKRLPDGRSVHIDRIWIEAEEEPRAGFYRKSIVIDHNIH